MKAYASILDVPGEVDHAIIVIPAEKVPGVLEECGRKGVKFATIISAGFREAETDEGPRLHREIGEICSRYGIRVIGPNTFGLVNLSGGFAACFTPAFTRLRRGYIALVSQSGGVCHSLLSYSLHYGIGFSKIVGLGDRLNVDFHDMLYYLAEDQDTKAIALYIEGVDEPRKLMEALRYTIPKKPVVVYKACRAKIADKVSMSHTGSLAGNYRIYQGMIRQVGGIEAYSIQEMVSYAKALALQGAKPVENVAILSLVGGLGIITLDIVEEVGLRRAEFSEETRKVLYRLVPPYTHRDNPVDVGIIFSDLESVAEIVDAILSDPNVDALVIVYVYSWTEPMLNIPIREVVESYKAHNKPVVAVLSYPPGSGKWDGYRDYLEENGIPVYPWPDLAVKSLAAIGRYYDVLRRKYS